MFLNIFSIGVNEWLTSRYEPIVLRKIKELADGWKKRERNYINSIINCEKQLEYIAFNCTEYLC